MLYQTRHVVYHSHYPCIFYSHGTNDAERPDIVVRTDSIRRSDQSAIAHRTRGVLAPNHDVHVAGIVRRVVNTLVEDFDEARLLFERLEQIAHSVDIDEV